jgi:hypothetical protein
MPNKALICKIMLMSEGFELSSRQNLKTTESE